MPRTTLVIDDDLLKDRRTFREVANELLRQARKPQPRESFTLKLRGWKAVEQPGVELLDRNKLFDLMDGR